MASSEGSETTMANHETLPFKDLDNFLDWSPQNDPFDVPLQARSDQGLRVVKDDSQQLLIEPLSQTRAPRTLVCHDHKDNYGADRYYEGSAVSSVIRPFTFNLWSACDVFVYFDHKLISQPPRCYTEAAHRNGSLILATFITENKEGEDTCERILRDEVSMDLFISQCIQLARHEGFDGYLVNIENELKEPLKMKHLINRLTQRIHDELSSSALILWYDAVTIEGKLEWQNELNTKNKAFFDVCDGIYLNYAWDKQKLESSKTFTSEARFHDIYVGLDIFGRGMIGDGGFNTKEAYEIVDQVQLSSAIFAPGWTHEEVEGDKDTFMIRDSNFWRNLWTFLTLKGPKIKMTRGEEFVTNLNNGCQKLTKEENEEEGEKWYLRIRGQDHMTPFIMTKRLQEAFPHRDYFPIRIEADINNGKGITIDLVLSSMETETSRIPLLVCAISFEEGVESVTFAFHHHETLEEPFKLQVDYTDELGNMKSLILDRLESSPSSSSLFSPNSGFYECNPTLHLLSLIVTKESLPNAFPIRQVSVQCN